MLEITQSFVFEAAHLQPGAPIGHPNARVHGHSFVAEVTLAGEPDEHGMIQDFDVFTAALNDTREALDHHFLNEVEGLEKPTLEQLCVWIYRRLQPTLPAISAVTVRRPTLNHSCTYRAR